MSLGRAGLEDHIFDAAIEGGYAVLGGEATSIGPIPSTAGNPAIRRFLIAGMKSSPVPAATLATSHSCGASELR